jgi:hypothetical protein
MRVIGMLLWWLGSGMIVYAVYLVFGVPAALLTAGLWLMLIGVSVRQLPRASQAQSYPTRMTDSE